MLHGMTKASIYLQSYRYKYFISQGKGEVIGGLKDEREKPDKRTAIQNGGHGVHGHRGLWDAGGEHTRL